MRVGMNENCMQIDERDKKCMKLDGNNMIFDYIRDSHPKKVLREKEVY